METWKAVKGYEGRYEVSDLGRVRNSRTLRVLKPFKTWTGYAAVGLCRAGVVRKFQVHRLVATAFVPGHGPLVRHLNDARSDNHAENLAWGTLSQNQRDARRNGRTPLGERHHSSRLTTASVLSIRERRAAGEGIRPLAREYGVSHKTISNVVQGRTWAHAA